MIAVDVSMKSEDDQIYALATMACTWGRIGRADMKRCLIITAQRVELRTEPSN